MAPFPANSGGPHGPHGPRKIGVRARPGRDGPGLRFFVDHVDHGDLRCWQEMLPFNRQVEKVPSLVTKNLSGEFMDVSSSPICMWLESKSRRRVASVLCGVPQNAFC